MSTDSEQTRPERQRRRRYDRAFKQALVEQTLTPGASVARIARDHDINANQLFKWRRQHLADQPRDAAMAQAALVPVTIVSDDAAADAAPSDEPAPAAGQMEVVLTGGTVRIQDSVDATMLRLLLSSLSR